MQLLLSAVIIKLALVPLISCGSLSVVLMVTLASCVIEGRYHDGPLLLLAEGLNSMSLAAF
jgi:hypothetical protein